MSDWSDLGLPCPLVAGYSYQRNAGLLRTPFASPAPEQRQALTSWVKSLTLAWGLSQAQLQLAEAYLLANGFSWWDLDMLGFDEDDNVITEVWQVRLTADYQITSLAGGVYQLSAPAEVKRVPVACVLATCDDAPAAVCST